MSVTDAELREIEELRRKHATPGMTAGEFHAFLPERLRRPYWESKLDELLGNAGGPLVIVPEDADLVDADRHRWSWRGGYTQPSGGAHYWTPEQIEAHAGPVREETSDE